MYWKLPPKIKIYEALGAIADGRLEVIHSAEVQPRQIENVKVWSSSRTKFYDVSYDHATGAIMANDNGSYWQGYLGYPSIAHLMQIGRLSYDKNVGELLKDIKWKELNTKHKNNFSKSISEILAGQTKCGRANIEDFVQKVEKEIKALSPAMLGKKKLPPKE